MGYQQEVVESYLGICYWDISVPCGMKWCKGWLNIPYPCGIKWCRTSFGIPYPCGTKWCNVKIPIIYPCGIKWCTVSIPYPCRKYRRVTKYCYRFSSVKDDCKVVVETHYGCEDGKEYKWTDGCLGWFTYYRSGVQVCFDEPLKDLGPCRGGYSLPHGDVPHDPQWQDGVAIGGTVMSPLIREEERGKQMSDTEYSVQFAPPMHVRKFCATCFIGKLIIVAAVIVSLICIIRFFI